MSFSCIKINGNSYHVKDATARTDIATLKTRVQTLENNAGSGGSGGSSGYTSTKLGAIGGYNQTQTLSQSWRNFDALMFAFYNENDDSADCFAIEVPRSVLEGCLLAENDYGDSCTHVLFDKNILGARQVLKVSSLTATSWKVISPTTYSGSNIGIYGIKY